MCFQIWVILTCWLFYYCKIFCLIIHNASCLKSPYVTSIETLLFVFLKNFLFCIGVQLINNVIVSGEQDSAVHMHISMLPQTLLPSRLPHNLKQSHVLYNRSLLGIHFKYSSVYMSIPSSLTIPSPDSFPLSTISSFSRSVSFFRFCH